VFENRVLKRIIGLKREEVTGQRRKSHNEGLCHLQLEPNIIRAIKSRRMWWAGHKAGMGTLVNTKMNLWVTQHAENFSPSFATVKHYQETYGVSWLVGWLVS
jgi:hypothetical protein